jgi:hypothetical protein
VLDALDPQRELAREHRVDLLLVLVRVDAPALASAQHDQVDAERLDTELLAQRLEALAVIAVDTPEAAVAIVAPKGR